MKKNIVILMCTTLFFNGCTVLENEYENISKDMINYKEISKSYKVRERWWEGYADLELNRVVELGLQNNKDLAKATININRALYNANLIGAELVPQFSGSLGSSASKSAKDGGSSTISHGGEIALSYEIDLWRRLADKKDAKEWEYKATIQDFEETKLALINNIVNAYFSIIYLDNYIKLSKQMTNNYSDIENIVENKLKYGTGSILDQKEAERETVKSKNSLLSYEIQKKEQEGLLRELLNLKPNEGLNIQYKEMSTVKTLGVDLEVPLEAIGNRPDIKSYEYRLQSTFKSSLASEKQLYPDVTISSSLSSSSDKVKSALNTPIGLGSISINLPFLNWNEIKWNVKLDRADYEEAKENFYQGVTTALNELDYNYYNYLKESRNYINMVKIASYDKEIANSYENRYKNGKSELKDWLNALTTQWNSELNMVNSKYLIIKSENAVYQSLGGRVDKVNK